MRIRFLVQILVEELNALGVKVLTHNQNFFDTITLDCSSSGFSSSDFLLSEFHKFGINLRKVDENLVSISFNETTTLADLDEVVEIFVELKGS